MELALAMDTIFKIMLIPFSKLASAQELIFLIEMSLYIFVLMVIC